MNLNLAIFGHVSVGGLVKTTQVDYVTPSLKNLLILIKFDTQYKSIKIEFFENGPKICHLGHQFCLFGVQ